jgi:hypothetical protein
MMQRGRIDVEAERVVEAAVGARVEPSRFPQHRDLLASARDAWPGQSGPEALRHARDAEAGGDDRSRERGGVGDHEIGGIGRRDRVERVEHFRGDQAAEQLGEQLLGSLHHRHLSHLGELAQHIRGRRCGVARHGDPYPGRLDGWHPLCGSGEQEDVVRSRDHGRDGVVP